MNAKRMPGPPLRQQNKNVDMGVTALPSVPPMQNHQNGICGPMQASAPTTEQEVSTVSSNSEFHNKTAPDGVLLHCQGRLPYLPFMT